MMLQPRGYLLAGGAIVGVVLASVTACGGGPDLDAAARADAACRSALHDRLQLAEGDALPGGHTDVTVERGTWIVRGSVPVASGVPTQRFQCTVVKDSHNQLRGVRVTDLTLQG